jgi:broad specificity phosphatase PhoE
MAPPWRVSWLPDQRCSPAFPTVQSVALRGERLPGHSGATAPDLHRLPHSNALSVAILWAGRFGVNEAPSRHTIEMSIPVTRLTLLRHGATAATRNASFPAGEPLEQTALEEARSLAPRLDRHDAVWCSTAPCARETAEALRLVPAASPSLDDADAGDWRGRTIEDVARTDHEALAAWTSDPAAAPPGGESLLEVLARVGRWLDAQAASGHRVLAVTHTVVIRAAVVHALSAPPAAAWRIDVAPLSRTVLHARDGRWTVRGMNLGHTD